jgi:hypothetical protein
MLRSYLDTTDHDDTPHTTTHQAFLRPGVLRPGVVPQLPGLQPGAQLTLPDAVRLRDRATILARQMYAAEGGAGAARADQQVAALLSSLSIDPATLPAELPHQAAPAEWAALWESQAARARPPEPLVGADVAAAQAAGAAAAAAAHGAPGPMMEQVWRQQQQQQQQQRPLSTGWADEFAVQRQQQHHAAASGSWAEQFAQQQQQRDASPASQDWAHEFAQRQQDAEAGRQGGSAAAAAADARATSARLVDALTADGDPKMRNSKFLQFLSKMSKGDIEFEDNKVCWRAWRWQRRSWRVPCVVRVMQCVRSRARTHARISAAAVSRCRLWSASLARRGRTTLQPLQPHPLQPQPQQPQRGCPAAPPGPLSLASSSSSMPHRRRRQRCARLGIGRMSLLPASPTSTWMSLPQRSRWRQRGQQLEVRVAAAAGLRVSCIGCMCCAACKHARCQVLQGRTCTPCHRCFVARTLAALPSTTGAPGASTWANEFAEQEAEYGDWDTLYARNAEVWGARWWGLRRLRARGVDV